MSPILGTGGPWHLLGHGGNQALAQGFGVIHHPRSREQPVGGRTVVPVSSCLPKICSHQRVQLRSRGSSAPLSSCLLQMSPLAIPVTELSLSSVTAAFTGAGPALWPGPGQRWLPDQSPLPAPLLRKGTRGSLSQRWSKGETPAWAVPGLRALREGNQGFGSQRHPWEHRADPWASPARSLLRGSRGVSSQELHEECS